MSPIFRRDGGATKDSRPDSWKAASRISSSSEPSGKVTDRRFLQPRKAPCSITLSARGNLMSSRPLLLKANADRDMLSYRCCMPLRSTCLSELQSEKAKSSIVRSDGGAVKDRSPEAAKARSPMSSRALSTRLICLSDRQYQKALFPIDFRACGKQASSAPMSSEQTERTVSGRSCPCFLYWLKTSLPGNFDPCAAPRFACSH